MTTKRTVELHMGEDATLFLLKPVLGPLFNKLAPAIETAAEDLELGPIPTESGEPRDGLIWRLEPARFRSARRRLDLVRFIAVDTRLSFNLEVVCGKLLKGMRGRWTLKDSTALAVAEYAENYRELTRIASRAGKIKTSALRRRNRLQRDFVS